MTQTIFCFLDMTQTNVCYFQRIPNFPSYGVRWKIYHLIEDFLKVGVHRIPLFPHIWLGYHILSKIHHVCLHAVGFNETVLLRGNLALYLFVYFRFNHGLKNFRWYRPQSNGPVIIDVPNRLTLIYGLFSLSLIFRGIPDGQA